MTWLRRIFGTNFPDPAAGQIWRSRHSGRAFRVQAVTRSDCGRLWHLDLQHETIDGVINPLAMRYYMPPWQWRAMLREEGRALDEWAGR
jgi:hypothetical protein